MVLLGAVHSVVVNLIFDVVSGMYALVCHCYRPAACAVLALSKTLAMEAADAECHELVILEANLGDFVVELSWRILPLRPDAHQFIQMISPMPGKSTSAPGQCRSS